MKFGIEIRNIQTGAFHVLEDLQAVSNFLVGKVHAEWEGFRNLGKLPEPTVPAEAAPVAEGSAAVVDEPAAAVSAPVVPQETAFVSGNAGSGESVSDNEVTNVALDTPVADAAPSSSEPS